MRRQLRTVELALRAAAVVFLLIAAVARVWPVAPPAEVVAPAGLDVPKSSGPAAVANTAAGQAIVMRNIFSASRRPPAARYDPRGPTPAEAAAADPYATTPAADPDEQVPRLFGIVNDPRGPSALLRLDPNSPDAQVYREGDKGGVYRVVRITGTSVVLSSPRGQIVLRLRSPEGQKP